MALEPEEKKEAQTSKKSKETISKTQKEAVDQRSNLSEDIDLAFANNSNLDEEDQSSFSLSEQFRKADKIIQKKRKQLKLDNSSIGNAESTENSEKPSEETLKKFKNLKFKVFGKEFEQTNKDEETNQDDNKKDQSNPPEDEPLVS